MFKKNNLLYYFSIITFIISILSMIPLACLGMYIHALGDDFYYGYHAKQALSNGNILNTISAAFNGMTSEYIRWQGTYSAMFLMHLPPHIFGDIFYKIYPTVLIICLAFSVFFLLKPIICLYLQQKKTIWIIISSIISFLFLQQSPVMGEAFYWYNGSMYYTGFYSLTLIFFGGIMRFLYKPTKYHIVLLSLCGFFIAGGNYASLLPALIILYLITIYFFFFSKKTKKFIGLCIITFSTSIGFIISVIAPGNAARQATSFGTTPIKAILKSLMQGLHYLLGWSNIWLFIALAILTPIFVIIIKDSVFSFKYPIIILALFFGIFSSASCPTFYAQNNGGAARVFVLSWYNMVFLLIGCYFYLLGWYVNHVSKKPILVGEIAIISLFFALLLLRPISATYIQLNSVKALQCITSGDALYYEKQYQQRVNQLNSPERKILFEPYDVPESLMYIIHLGDLSSDPSHFSNEAFAAFYDKESVAVTK